VDRTTFRAKRNGSGMEQPFRAWNYPQMWRNNSTSFQGRRAFHMSGCERIRFRTYGQHSGTEKKGKMGVYDGCGF